MLFFALCFVLDVNSFNNVYDVICFVFDESVKAFVYIIFFV